MARAMQDAQDQTLKRVERLQFVEFLLYFNGSVNREDIANRFGISQASSTNVLSAYHQLAPQNLSYNVRQKCYEIARSFTPVFNRRLFTERIPVYTMPRLDAPENDESIEKIAAISRAIQKTQSLTITYVSASSGESARQIVPVALADNSLRWHLRAFDRKNARFGDFALSRLKSVSPIESDIIQDFECPSRDLHWHSFVELQIAVHPSNVADPRSFEMENGPRRVSVRAAMAGYFLQLWNVDCSPDAGLRGPEYQYFLVN
ncbi:MAG: WYL domain-containing protein, partial [Candidatus Dadabacteria bacterium]|nr:WYL domain-containing protein [Candidatus Dadabacteria bacterium]